MFLKELKDTLKQTGSIMTLMVVLPLIYLLDSWALNGTVGIALMHEGQLFTVDRYADGVVIAHDVIR